MSEPCSNFMVRLADRNRHAFTIVCEQCGCELPIGTLNLINVDAVGHVMLEHFDQSGREVRSPVGRQVDECCCGQKFRTAEDYRDHLPCDSW